MTSWLDPPIWKPPATIDVTPVAAAVLSNVRYVFFRRLAGAKGLSRIFIFRRSPSPFLSLCSEDLEHKLTFIFRADELDPAT